MVTRQHLSTFLQPRKRKWRACLAHLHGFVLPPVLVFAMVQLISSAVAAKLDTEFLNPPLAARPEVIWYWRHELHTKEGITADLEAMNRVGIGGVLIGFIGGHDEPKGDVTMLSPKWREMFGHAVREAQRLGIRVNMWNSPGWSSSGGPWITPELAMQKLTWSETRVKGPGKPTEPLARPHASKLGNTWSVTKEKPALWNDYYRDIAVLAFPTPTAELWDGAPPVVTTDDPKFDVNKIADRDSATFASLANPAPGATNWLRFDFGKPFPARSLAVNFREWDASVKSVEVAQSDDGATWRVIRRCTVRGTQGLPVNATIEATPARHWRVGFISDPKGPAKMDLAEVALLSGTRIEDWTGKAMFDKFGLHKPPFTAAPALADGAIPRDRILDLTDRLRTDGTLDWEMPAGDWTVVRYGRTLTLALNGPATPPGTGLECDKLNPAALDHHWNSYLAPLFAEKSFNEGVACVHIDSYEKHAQNWSPRLPDEFRKRRGYDLIRFLPAMTGRVIESVETTERFLWDLRQTLCDTMADAYYGRMAELCHKQGKLFSVEPYHQVQFDNVTVGGRGDLVVTEFWNGGWPGPYWFKLGASPAHIYGKRIVGAEAFTAGSKDGGNWSTDPWSLKALGDSAYCSGVNHFIFHVSTQQPWTNAYPGLTSGPWGQHIERGNTWFELSGGWLKYLARCQHMLQQGEFVGDVLYSVGENTPNESHDGGKGLPPGYDYDTISPEAMLTRLTVKNGRFALPDGVSYAVLVLPENDDFMTAAMAEKLRTLVKAGGTIMGRRPSRSPSLNNQPAEDKTVRAIADDLWGDLDGRQVTERRVGNGRIFLGRPLSEVLHAIGVRPDFTYAAQGLGLKYIHRRTREADLYFVADATWPIRAASAPGVSVDARFRVTGRVPELWDAVTGEIRPLPEYRVENGETIVPLRFEPRQSWFVVFREKLSGVKGPVSGANFPVVRNLCEIGGPWEVRFDPKWGGPNKPVSFTNLQDWSQHADPAIRYYSGTAVYRTTFHLATHDAKSRRFLSLGTIKNVAAVRLNGRALGTVWCSPWRVEITPALCVGSNSLEITVANLWPNRLIGDEQLPDDCEWTMTGFGTASLKAWPDWLLNNSPRISGRYGFASWRHWKKDDALFPSGLLGPVEIHETDISVIGVDRTMSATTAVSQKMAVRKISRGEHCVHYYFQQSPESPDGARVLYSSLKKNEKATEVFVCARDGSTQTKIGTVAGCSAHMGACAIWIDNETVAFAESETAEVRLVHLPDLTVRTFTGAIDEYSPANGKIIFHAGRTLAEGIYTLDVRTGERTCLITMANLERFAVAMNRPFDADLWHLDHACWSPDGKHFIFEIKAGAKSTNKDDYLLHAKADGSDVTLIGIKPMHPHWWDNESIFGHDWHQKSDTLLRRWGLDNKGGEELAGAGCHGAVSADRRWIVTESWYGADPIELRLFRRGRIKPSVTLYSQKRSVQGQDFWAVRSHVHPAFSADGQRVYFNAWPEGEPGPQVFCADVSEYLRQSEAVSRSTSQRPCAQVDAEPSPPGSTGR